MYINPIRYHHTQYTQAKPQKQPQVSFTSNPNSHILEFLYNDFFVNIEGYGKNTDWAREAKLVADKAVEKIKNTDNADDVLPSIAFGIRGANQYCWGIKKKQHSGLLRTYRRGYGTPGRWLGKELTTPIDGMYKKYYDKLQMATLLPIKNPYQDISLTKVERDEVFSKLTLTHGDGECINSALDRVGNKYSKLHKKFISKPENVTSETLPEINSDVAEIRWIMAHSMPWERGSDAISNVFTRALYKSMGIKTYPLKEGISLDLEAFCTPLEKYKNNFHTYFEQNPRVIE